MNKETLSSLPAISLEALKNHARRYKVVIPKALESFYASELSKLHLRWARAQPPGFGSGAFQLALTPPTWLNKGDDCVNGTRGEWKAAKYFLPIFVADQELFVVVDLRTADCRVGWYQEETFSDDDDGDFKNGVQQSGMSLAEFLTTLIETLPESEREKAFTVSDPDQEDAWEEEFDDDAPRAFDAAQEEEAEE